MTAAILEFCPAGVPESVSPERATTHFVRAGSRVLWPIGHRRFVCRWHKGPDGRLVCVWEPDIGPIWRC